VTIVAEALARLTGPWPAILQPRQAVRLKPMPLMANSRAPKDPVVTANEPDEAGASSVQASPVFLYGG
jgi:hypothetical protein